VRRGGGGAGAGDGGDDGAAAGVEHKFEMSAEGEDGAVIPPFLPPSLSLALSPLSVPCQRDIDGQGEAVGNKGCLRLAVWLR
jgi:hypothetical protein